MEHIDNALKPNRIHSTPGIPIKRRDYLHDSMATKAFEGLCRWIGLALLGSVERLPEISPNLDGKGSHVFLRGSNPSDGLKVFNHYISIRLFVYEYLQRGREYLYAQAYRYSTKLATAPSSPCTFGFAESMR